jgi:magnesium-transporting ATPase (P-type)
MIYSFTLAFGLYRTKQKAQLEAVTVKFFGLMVGITCVMCLAMNLEPLLDPTKKKKKTQINKRKRCL